MDKYDVCARGSFDFVRDTDYNIITLFYSHKNTKKENGMNYLSIREMSEKWGICPRRIQVLCANDRIPGATRVGTFWIIPEDAEKPKDARIKSGKYIKEKIIG